MQPNSHTTAAPVAAPPQTTLLDEIVAQQQEIASRYMPVMSPSQAVTRMKAIKELKDLVLVEGEDYGKIPGTDKPTLLKPGAEKIASFFGYVPRYELLPGSLEDWAGAKFGEPLFYYHVVCTLYKDGKPVGQGTGSASTWERKYRYRAAKRTCPECGKDVLIKGKPEFEKNPEFKKRGAFICFEKKGGCGAKFFGDDERIMNQPLGEVANPDFADIINTVQKMADKRAYIAAVLSATGASQWFTQDLEDMQSAEEVAEKYGVQAGTKEAAQQVAQQKIEQGRQQAAAQQQQQQHKQQSGPDWKATFLKRARAANEKLGSPTFYRILGEFGFEDAEQVQSRDKALEIYNVLLATINNPPKQQEEPQQAAAETTDPEDRDSWVPENIGGAQ